MADRYTIINAGRQTDFGPFWKFFDNYMLKAAQHEYMDEQILGWYLTDGYHEDFYRKIFDSLSSTRLFLFYREREIINNRKKKRGLKSLFHYQSHKGNSILANQRLDYRTSEGTCIGFCILDQTMGGESEAWILALSLEGLNGENQEKVEAWRLFEEQVKKMGIRVLETSGYQDLKFWTANGFEAISNHVVKKRL